MSAAVASVEEHGYVMDVGLADVRCFLTKKPTDMELSVGQICQTNVVQCQLEGTVATVTLSLQPEVKFKQNVELNVSTLTPGTRVHVNVTKVSQQGLMVTFGNLLGYVYKDHLARPTDQLSAYAAKPKLVAVVLYTLPLVNAVYLSLKTSLVAEPQAAAAAEALAIGRVFDTAKVVESSSVGVFVKLNEQSKGFVPLRHLSDSKELIEDVAAHHPVKTQRRCRILQRALMDDVYICTMKKSLVNEKLLRYEDLTIGDRVTATIESVNSGGVSVRLGAAALKGFVPKLHWADDPRLRKPELRFRAGETLQCRVLKLDVERRQLHLTAKASLVEQRPNDDDDAPVCSRTEQLQKTMRLKGTVSLIDKGGVLVSFFGQATGWIPKARLDALGVVDIGRHFFPGQVVDCVVDSVQQETGKVTLNLIKIGDTVDIKPVKSKSRKPTAAAADGDADNQVGCIVECRVTSVHLEGSTAGIEVGFPFNTTFSLFIHSFISAINF